MKIVNINQTALILISISLFIASSFAQKTETKAVNKQIDNYINETMKQHKIPGLALAVIKDGRVIHKNFYGKASIEHNVPVDEAILNFR